MVLAVLVVWLFNCLNILREYERGVVFRLGRPLKNEKGPGLVLILWPFDKIVTVSSADGGPRSSAPKASSRRPPGWPKPPNCSIARPRRLRYAICRR